jgi:hypothetical protein
MLGSLVLVLVWTNAFNKAWPLTCGEQTCSFFNLHGTTNSHNACAQTLPLKVSSKTGLAHLKMTKSPQMPHSSRTLTMMGGNATTTRTSIGNFPMACFVAISKQDICNIEKLYIQYWKICENAQCSLAMMPHLRRSTTKQRQHNPP